MRVFITGGTGFIGRHLVRRLTRLQHEVVVLTRRAGGNAAEFGFADGVRMVAYQPERAFDAIRAMTPGPADCFLHLAWYAEPGKYLASSENIDCALGSLSLVRDLIAHGVGHFVMAGTCLEYDIRLGWLTEDAPTRPETLYAKAKLAVSDLARALAIGSGTRVAVGRIFHLYGPGEDDRRVVPGAVKRLAAGERFATTSGYQVRDFSHVEDVAGAFATIVERRGEGVFNVASGEPISLRSLVGKIGEFLGRAERIDFGAIPMRPDEPECLCGSNARLRGLGWRPEHNLDKGLRQYVESLALSRTATSLVT